MKRLIISYMGILLIMTILSAFYPTDLLMVMQAVILLMVTIFSSWLYALAMGAVCMLVFWFLTGSFLLAASFLGTAAVLGMVCGLLMKKRKSYQTVLVGGAGVVLLSRFALYYNIGAQSGQTIVEVLTKQPLEQLAVMSEQMAASFGEILNAGELASFSTQMQQMTQDVSSFVRMAVPGYLVVSALAMAFLTIAITRYTLDKIHFDTSHMARFYQLCAGRIVTIAYLVCIVLLFFASGQVFSALVNAVFVLTFIHMACGVSYLDFVLRKTSLGAGVRWLIIIGGGAVLFGLGMVIVFINPIFLLTLLGVADSLFNLRKLR